MEKIIGIRTKKIFFPIELSFLRKKNEQLQVSIIPRISKNAKYLIISYFLFAIQGHMGKILGNRLERTRGISKNTEDQSNH